MELNELFKKGGIYYGLEGNSTGGALESLCFTLAPQKNISRTTLLKAVLEREALMPTSIGFGIALPHPRNPLIDEPDDQFAALGFLKQPIDWNALDRKPVSTLILIVSSSAKSHLASLSRISFLCHDTAFQKLLNEKAPANMLLEYIKKAEEEWK